MERVTSSRPVSTSATASSSSPSGLQSATAGNFIRRGETSDRVRQLQTELNARGYALELDGKFGPATEQAVRDFQSRTSAKVDGVVGPETVGKLQAHAPGNVPGTPSTGESRFEDAPSVDGPQVTPPVAGTEREQFEMYAAMVRRAGGEVCPNGQPTVLGLRQGVGGANRSYQDTFVVLTPDGRARTFSGATYPGQSSSRASPDVTGDGVGDVGMIRPGNYQVVPNGQFRGADSFHVRTLGGSGNIPGWRDTNHDGTFSDAERSRSQSRGDSLTDILFHQGNPNSPSSIGCQTMSPEVYRQFVAAIGGSRASFSFTLVSVQ